MPEGTAGALALSGNANGVGYIDFGTDFSDIRITGTWTLFKSWSGGNHSLYTEAWWDDDTDATNDGTTETNIDFHTATGLPHLGQVQWSQDANLTSSPVTPQGRYLILRAGTVSNFSGLEYAVVGYVDSGPSTETDFTSYSLPGSLGNANHRCYQPYQSR